LVFLFFSYHNDARSNKHQMHRRHLGFLRTKMTDRSTLKTEANVLQE